MARKFYRDNKGAIWEYEADGSQDHLIGDKIALTDDEAIEHIAPTKKAEEIIPLETIKALTYLNSTDWVEPFILRHELGINVLPEDSNKLAIHAKREETRAFLRANQ